MRKSLIWFYAIAGLTLFNLIGWPFKIRFTSIVLNYWFIVLLCIALPISTWTAAQSSERKAIRISGKVLALLLTIITILAGSSAYMDATYINTRGYDASFETVGTVSSGSFTYRLYRTNGGATTDYGLELRREFESPFGIKLVQTLWSKYHEFEGDLTLVSNKEIQIRAEGVLIASIKL